MQELEKVLKEIEQRVNYYREHATFDYVDICTGLREAEDVIRKHMNDGWISVDNPPETGKRCLVKIKHHAWIADYDSDWIPEEEKTYHAEHTEICEAIYQDNDAWCYLDLQDGECTAYTKPGKYPEFPVVEVLEWQYMPQLQPETCKYTGGSCCWPIDQCSDCPNNPERSEKK